MLQCLTFLLSDRLQLSDSQSRLNEQLQNSYNSLFNLAVWDTMGEHARLARDWQQLSRYFACLIVTQQTSTTGQYNQLRHTESQAVPPKLWSLAKQEAYPLAVQEVLELNLMLGQL